MKHRIGIGLIAALMVLCAFSGALAVGAGGSGARSASSLDGDVWLGGDYIEIGVSATGSFGTKAAAPTAENRGGGYIFPSLYH